MIHRIWAIALNTFREAIRQKILYTLVFFTVILILFSLFLGQLSLGADTKVVKDMGLASMMFFGSIMSIFMGIGLVFKEVERRTLYTLLSKPVTRADFILGKFLGLSLTVLVEILFMAGLLFALLCLYREPLDFQILKAVFLIYLELNILIAVALVFSSYSSAFMSSLFCLSFLVMGHITREFGEIFSRQVGLLHAEPDFVTRAGGQALQALIVVLGWMDLDFFAISDKVVHGVEVPWNYIFQAVVFAGSWIVLILTLAVFLFEKKDLQ